jgi:hypothetical protein
MKQPNGLHRLFTNVETTKLPLDIVGDVKTPKDRFGVTLDDVVLSVVSALTPVRDEGLKQVPFKYVQPGGAIGDGAVTAQRTAGGPATTLEQGFSARATTVEPSRRRRPMEKDGGY